MAESKKARIFLRRGLDADRLQTPLCEGELGYSTDSKRVFVGDGSTDGGYSLGTTLFIKDSASFNLGTLNDGSSSGEGKGEVGDLLLKPAADFNIIDINSNATSCNISPNPEFSTVHALTSYAGNTLSWVAINSGIPFSHIDIGNDYINGDYIHGGDISGDVTFSDDITVSDSVTLDGVATNAENAALLTGNIIYPLGITANAQVTAVSSVFSLGAKTAALGNSIGYVKAVFSTNTPISATNIGNDVTSTLTKSSAGTDSSSSNVSLASHIGATYFGTTSYSSGTGTYIIKAITYTLSDIRNALNQNSITWDSIEEFYFSVYADQKDDSVAFFGFANESTGDNEICFFSGTSISSGRMRLVPNLGRVIITNTYSSTESLTVHVGMDYNTPRGKISYVLTGVKVKI